MAGKIFLVGIGPGSKEHITPRAVQALMEAGVIIGYETYLELVREFLAGKEVISRKMMQEVERAELAVEKAREGKSVALVSSGDPGVYAMASMVFEYLKEKNISLDVEVVPGITAANAAAALLGSPLGHDFAVISLSDLLTLWEVIEKRLESAAKGDFVVVLYNPKSKGRTQQIEKAQEILLKHRSPSTPVGIVRNAMREGESVVVTTLEKMLAYEIDMLTTIIVGNSESFVHDGKIVTPRGYKGKYELK